MIKAQREQAQIGLGHVFVLLCAVEALVLLIENPSSLLMPLAIVLNWPGMLILGADETTERFGRWGERVLYGICSMPVLLAYACVICSFFPNRSAASGKCAACGYDLRASPDRCPECGRGNEEVPDEDRAE